MSNPANKARELMRAAKSKALIEKQEQIIVEKKEEFINDQVINKENNNEIKLEDKTNQVQENLVENVKSIEEIKLENEFENLDKITENNLSLKDRIKMFDTKINKPNNIPKSLGKPPTNDTGNKIGLLSRMNKTKEKEIKIMTKEIKDVPKLEESIDKTKEPITNKVEDTIQAIIPPLENKDKDKLMKRMTTAKGMAKGLSTAGGMIKKPSERIMQMANNLQSSISLGQMPPKKKFLLNDDDIQRIDDEKKEEFKFVEKNLIEIILEKPINKNVKKQTRQIFDLK